MKDLEIKEIKEDKCNNDDNNAHDFLNQYMTTTLNDKVISNEINDEFEILEEK